MGIVEWNNLAFPTSRELQCLFSVSLHHLFLSAHVTLELQETKRHLFVTEWLNM